MAINGETANTKLDGTREGEMLNCIACEVDRLTEAARRIHKVLAVLGQAATMLRTGRGAKTVGALLDEAGVSIDRPNEVQG